LKLPHRRTRRRSKALVFLLLAGDRQAEKRQRLLEIANLNALQLKFEWIYNWFHYNLPTGEFRIPVICIAKKVLAGDINDGSNGIHGGTKD
jgi:hypothetical protein